MTKKHFKALAEELRNTRPIGTYIDRFQWQRDVNAVAKVCGMSNPNFDEDRFLTACGFWED